MVRLAEHPDEVEQGQAETLLGFCGADGGDARLLAHDQLEFRQHFGHQGSIGAQGLFQLTLPLGQPFVALGQDLLHQIP